MQVGSWVRKILWRRKCNPLQYPYLGGPMDRGAWRTTVHGVTKSQTRLSGWARTHAGTETEGQRLIHGVGLRSEVPSCQGTVFCHVENSKETACFARESVVVCEAVHVISLENNKMQMWSVGIRLDQFLVQVFPWERSSCHKNPTLRVWCKALTYLKSYCLS